MKWRLGVPDFVSSSYFPAIAAVQLGCFAEEGLDVELQVVFPVPACFEALRAGELEFVATSAHGPLWAFPRWRGSKLLCALSQGLYWFLVMRPDLPIAPGDVTALRNVRIAAAPGVDVALIMLLEEAGVDLDERQISIGLPAKDLPKGESFGVAAARALAEGQIDGFWANGMGAALATSSGIARCIIDVRREQGPKSAFYYTAPALTTRLDILQDHKRECEAAVRAIVRAQNLLKADPKIAEEVAKPIFPDREASLIVQLIERDLPFYSPQLSEDFIDGMNRFAMRAGLLDSPKVSYEDIVAIEMREFWGAN